jgi:hypothetical protein
MDHKLFSSYFLLCVLPACIHDTHFRQAKQIACDRNIILPYLRSQAFYNQFSTVILIDALWLTEPVRKLHNILYHTRHADNYPRLHSRFLTEKAEPPVYAFYILMSSLLQEGAWSVTLKINNNNAEPVLVEQVIFEPEYQYLFGKSYTRPYLLNTNLIKHRTAYYVVFDNPFKETYRPQLTFHFTYHNVTIKWP